MCAFCEQCERRRTEICLIHDIGAFQTSDVDLMLGPMREHVKKEKLTAV